MGKLYKIFVLFVLLSISSADNTYSQAEVSNGYNALANLKSKIFCCVILEWEMSDMTGLELLNQIRNDQLIKMVPVLIITEYGAIDNIVAATKAGANGIILKVSLSLSILMLLS